MCGDNVRGIIEAKKKREPKEKGKSCALAKVDKTTTKSRI